MKQTRRHIVCNSSKFRNLVKYLTFSQVFDKLHKLSAENSLDSAQSLRLKEWTDRNSDLSLLNAKNINFRLQNAHYPVETAAEILSSNSRSRNRRQNNGEDLENWTLTSPPFNFGFLPFGSCASMPLPDKYLEQGQVRQCCPEADSSCKIFPVHELNPNNRTCYCDLACKSWKDCCNDYLESCGWVHAHDVAERQVQTSHTREPFELIRFGLKVFGMESRMFEKVLTHGCHCSLLHPGLEPETIELLGGINPVDELDEICREWQTKRKCLEVDTCDNSKLGGYSYNFSYDSTLLNYKCDSTADDCERFFCEVDIIYLKKIADYSKANFLTFVPKNGNLECLRQAPTPMEDRRCCMRDLKVYEAKNDGINEIGASFLGSDNSSSSVINLPDVPVVSMNSGCPSGYFYDDVDETGEVADDLENDGDFGNDDIFGPDIDYNGGNVNIVMG